ncbi:MAG TPA: toll/interleukin-1 receptor domain-containing protein [Caulobacteraceae bacterium]
MGSAAAEVETFPNEGEAAAAPAPPRYWAFLSYSHADARWAAWLQRALETYVVPRRFIGRETPAGPAPRRLRPVFRDREELRADADLGERLETALAQSAYLIVICSPAAARSTWVNEEIRQFKARNANGRVLALIVAGEPFGSDQPGLEGQECFPKALRVRVGPDGALTDERIEPSAADLRPGRDSRRRALLRLIAGMLQVDLDELVDRDGRRRNRRLLALSAVSVGVAAGMCALAVVAVLSRNAAVTQRGRAEGLIEFMIGDLRKTLEPEGRLDALDAIGGRALDYYAGEPLGQLDADSLGRRARVLHLLGVIRQQRGDLGGALAFFRQAAATTGELLARYPNDPARIYDHAQSVAYLGEVALAQSDQRTALAQFMTYRQLADRLLALQPGKQDWWGEVEEANTNVGAVLLGKGRPDEAMTYFTRASSVAQRLVAQAPKRRERLWDLAQINAWMADSEAARGHVAAALADRQAESGIYAGLIATSPSDAGAIDGLASSGAEIARIKVVMGRRAEAVAELRRSVAALDQLIASAPDDAKYKLNAAPVYLLLGQTLLQEGRPDEADPVAEHLLEMSQQETGRASGDSVAWRGVTLGGARILMMKIAAADARAPADQRRALLPAGPEAARLMELTEAHPDNFKLAKAAAEAALLAGDSAWFSGDARPARRAWIAARVVLLRAAGARLLPTDRAHIILDQLSKRLANGHPPDAERPAPRDGNALGGLVNYDW